MCEERVAENGARAKRKENPEQSERPFRAARRAPAKINAVIAPEDGMQGVAVFTFRILVREYRDKQAGGDVDGKTPRGGVDRKRPTAPGQVR